MDASASSVRTERRRREELCSELTVDRDAIAAVVNAPNSLKISMEDDAFWLIRQLLEVWAAVLTARQLPCFTRVTLTLTNCLTRVRSANIRKSNRRDVTMPEKLHQRLSAEQINLRRTYSQRSGNALLFQRFLCLSFLFPKLDDCHHVGGGLIFVRVLHNYPTVDLNSRPEELHAAPPAQSWLRSPTGFYMPTERSCLSETPSQSNVTQMS